MITVRSPTPPATIEFMIHETILTRTDPKRADQNEAMCIPGTMAPANWNKRALMTNIKNLETTPSILLISHDRGIVSESQYVYLLQDDGHIITYTDPRK